MSEELDEFYVQISDSIVNLEDELGVKYAHEAIEKGYDLLQVIEHGYAAGIRRVGQLYDNGEYYLPELMLAANIMQDAMAVVNPILQRQHTQKSLGTVVMATIEGDIHSIGKDIVGIILAANGFSVINLGADVAIDKIINTAQAKKAQIIGVSALLTTTMQGQKTLIEKLASMGIRDQYKVILGGAPVTQKWADTCGADGYAGSAFEALDLARSLMGVS